MTVEVPTKAEHEAVAKTAADALERSGSVAAAATAANNAATSASQASASASAAVSAVGAVAEDVAQLTERVNAIPTVPAVPGPTPTAGFLYGQVNQADFTGATANDRLGAAMAYVAAQTFKKAILAEVIDKNTSQPAVYTTPRSVYDGFAWVFPDAVVEQPRGGNPYAGYAKVRMPAQADRNRNLSLFNWTDKSEKFGAYFNNLILEGDVNSGLFATDSDTVAWRAFFGRMGTSGFRHIWGRPNERFTHTACDFGFGPQNINNNLGAVFCGDGSDSGWGDGSRILIDCPPTFGGVARSSIDGSGKPQPFIMLDYSEKFTLQGVFCTTRGPQPAILVRSALNRGLIRIRDCELEGKNAGDPCFAPVVVVEGGHVRIRDCWMAYGGTNTGQSNYANAASSLQVYGGDVLVDGNLSFRANAMTDNDPVYGVSGGTLHIRDAGPLTSGVKPIARRTGSGVLDADSSVRVA